MGDSPSNRQTHRTSVIINPHVMSFKQCVCVPEGVCVCVCVSDRRGQPTIRDVDLEMVVKRIAGAMVYVSNSTIFIFFPGSGFSKSMNKHKQNTSDKNKLQ